MYASTSIETAFAQQMDQFQSEGTVDLAKRLRILTRPQTNGFESHTCTANHNKTMV